MNRYRSAIFGTAVVFLVILFGFLLRIQNLREWKRHPERAFLPDGRPALIDFDGYRYLRYAKEWAEGHYTGLDRLRAAPEGLPRPHPAPLLSMLTAGIVRVSGYAPEWVAAWIPPIVGSAVLSVALFLLGNFLKANPHLFPLPSEKGENVDHSSPSPRLRGGAFVEGLRRPKEGWGEGAFCPAVGLGFFAALFGICSPYFVFRSQFGRYDTDCAIPGLIVFLVFFSLRTFTGSFRSRLLGFTGFLVTLLLFAWWWDTARGLVLVLGLSGMTLAGVSAIRNRKRFMAVAGFLAVAVVLLFVLNKRGIQLPLLSTLLGMIPTLPGGEGGGFASIAEQQRPGFFPLIALMAGSGVVGLIALAGWIGLGFRHGRAVVGLGPVLLLGLLPFLGGQRFAVFSAPMIGIGLGWAVDALAKKIPAGRWRSVWVAVMCALLMSPAVGAVARRTDWPVMTPQAIHGMEQVAPLLPEDSVIWSWWDNGYHLMNYTGCATIEDGGCFRVPAFNAFPLCVTNERLAANFMSFYASRGEERVEWAYKKYGARLIHQLLAAGPREGERVLAAFGHKPARETIDFFFPPENERRPVFLFLDHLYLHTGYWWFWYGSKWSESQDRHPVFKVFYSIREAGGKLTGNPDFTIDLATGAMQFEGPSCRLNRVLARRPENVKAYDYSGDSDLMFEYDTKKSFGLLCSSPVADSMFSRLFFFDRGRYDHFELLLSNTPHVQCWRVRPDLP